MSLGKSTKKLLNRLHLQGDYVELQTLLSISCNWTRFPYSSKPHYYEILVRMTSENGVHLIQASGDQNYKTSVTTWKTTRMNDCVEPTTNAEMKCFARNVQRVHNCCFCGDFIFFCPGNLSCCLRSDNLSAPEDVWRSCSPAMRLPPCNTVHAIWSTAVRPRNWDRKNSNYKCSFNADGWDSIYLTIGINGEYPCSREVYKTTIADVFSSIGGVLGFFLGGSIISLIQCGVIGYRQLAAIGVKNAQGIKDAMKRRNLSSMVNKHETESTLDQLECV